MNNDTEDAQKMENDEEPNTGVEWVAYTAGARRANSLNTQCYKINCSAH